jgi:integrase
LARAKKLYDPTSGGITGYQAISMIDGKAVSGSRHRLEREALKAAKAKERDHEDGRLINRKDSVTLETFIRKEMDARQYYPSSRITYLLRAEMIIKVAGATKLADLDPTVCRTIHRKLCELLSPKGRPYARTTQKQTWNLFTGLIRSAQEQRLVNPGVLPYRVDWPYQESAPSTRDKYVTPEDADRFIAAVVADRPELLLAVKTIFETGCRIGEVIALAPADLADVGDVLAVTKSATRAVDSSWTIGPTKGKRDRQVPISAALAAELRAYRRSHGNARFLFPAPNGGMINYSSFLKQWDRSRFSTGINITPHVGRHAAATDMIRAGVHDSVVAAQLGHQSTKTLAAYYSEVQLQDQRDALEKRSAWRAARAKETVQDAVQPIEDIGE